MAAAGEPAEEIIRGLGGNGRKRAKGEYGEEGLYIASVDRLDAEVFREFTRHLQSGVIGHAGISGWMPRNTFHLQCELLRVPHSFSPGVKALEVAFNTILAEHPELRGYQNASAIERAFGRKLGFAAVTEADLAKIRMELEDGTRGSTAARAVASP